MWGMCMFKIERQRSLKKAEALYVPLQPLLRTASLWEMPAQQRHHQLGRLMNLSTQLDVRMLAYLCGC